MLEVCEGVINVIQIQLNFNTQVSMTDDNYYEKKNILTRQNFDMTLGMKEGVKNIVSNSCTSSQHDVTMHTIILVCI